MKHSIWRLGVEGVQAGMKKIEDGVYRLDMDHVGHNSYECIGQSERGESLTKNGHGYQ